jgi:hypothetical protein
MRCYDCGKSKEKLFEYPEGRRLIYLCTMCKAEREWRLQPDSGAVPSPPEVKKTLWQRIREFLGL